MYTCGPTVYNFAHIGNFRTYVFEDLLRRTIKFFGFEIEQVMNLTDVDDKTIKGALEKRCSLKEYTDLYKEAFFKDIATLGIEKLEHYPAATDFIPQMIEMIQILIDKGYAYKGQDGSIYYSISKFKRYGCLSHLDLTQLQVGASQRVNADEYDKEHASDFVLWKSLDKERDGDIYWESPFGPGRPGWHLECSAMAEAFLGKEIDIHVGGVDNIFPHHENEIAQSEACHGCRFSKMWIHVEHLVVDGKKMSKSLGNFFTLRQLLEKGFTGRQVRYLLLHTHHKTQLNFTLEGLEATKASLQRLDDFVIRLQRMVPTEGETRCQPLLQGALERFTQALGDDINISAALAVIYDLIRELNGEADKKIFSKEDLQNVFDLLHKFDQVLGIFKFEHALSIPDEVQKLFERRNEARREKNWSLADQLRDAIHAQGFVIEDTPQGARLKMV